MFRKYNSVKNVYDKREINKIFQRSDYNDLLFCVEEKIHGANFSILIENGEKKYFSRQFEVYGDKFYNWTKILEDEKIKKMISVFENMNFNSVQIIGELFGSNIQKGIYYSDNVNFKVFDIIIDDKYITTEEMCKIFKDNDIEDCLIPILETSLTFEQAINYNCEFNSKIANIDNNICEGIVIKPYNKVIIDGVGSTMYFKKKNEKFAEINKPKVVVAVPKYSVEVNNARNLFIACFTPQRLDNIESKLGKIMEKKDISKYVKSFVEDSLDEFNKLVDVSIFSEEERKFILKQPKVSGNLVYQRLLENSDNS